MSDNSSKEQLINTYLSALQLDEELDKILAKYKSSLILSALSFPVFGALIFLVSFLNLPIIASIIFLLMVVYSLLMCIGFGGSYMFLNFATISTKLKKIKVIGILLSILFFAVWFIVLILFPFINVVCTQKKLLKKSAELKSSLEQLKNNKELMKLLKK